MTIEQEVSKAVEYIAAVFKRQNNTLPCETLFGDGSNWKLIGRSGFKIVYDGVLDKWNQDKLTVKEAL